MCHWYFILHWHYIVGSFLKVVFEHLGKYAIEIVHLTFCNAHFGAVFLASLSLRIKFNGEMTKRQWSFWHSVLKQHSNILALLQCLISEYIHLPLLWFMWNFFQYPPNRFTCFDKNCTCHNIFTSRLDTPWITWPLLHKTRKIF